MRFFSATALWVSAALPLSNAFYVPGVHPETFQRNDEIPMKVNSMTSLHTQLPRDYYRLPFCRPDGGPKMASENLGEFLTGNKIQSSPYVINMLRDTYCQILCQVRLDGDDAKQLRLHTKYGYHNNWIIDNIPSATQGLSRATGEKQLHYAGGFPIGSVRINHDSNMHAPDSKLLYHNNWIIDNIPSATQGLSRATGEKQLHYAGGFPIGSVRINHDSNMHAPDSKLLAKKKFHSFDAYVYNHVNIILDYHQPEDGVEGYRVVAFAVEPMSIRHRYLNGFEWDGVSSDGFTKPLDSCPTGRHVTRGDIQENQIIEDGEQILYTYDVMWVESPVRWASRWDVYLTEDHMVPAQVHWYSITNSILVVVFLSLLVISILVRSLKRDIAGYNNTAQLSDEELEEQIEESGW
eukprot:CAMPEP_0171323160 /NCGR_PEP_ID=MMETSP0816-20121228/115401_1 /TAXON_ID=420281 /ORGANISM="Proboscia inermis, Strain CCAP1064/1" /LENGTH=406 /DNA_ID=CAMNT_0011821799 /DNA_START=70 /DNA_END=1287 /DNA_ORIENTATION=-